jgi:S-adenosylmethionine:tRNA ribosyltransferase-isomerase
MRMDLFDFDLPSELIAQRPADPRDAARLLVVEPERLLDRTVRALPELLRPGDLLVFNDTRVLPARLVGCRGEARVEVTLHREVAAHRWRAFARPARRCRPGDTLVFAPDFRAAVLARLEQGEIELAFEHGGAELSDALERYGIMPLPPYIGRPKAGDPRDRKDYQTMFARRDGAVAAPTAALHFTPALMEALAARGIGHAFLTLHVGAGTFLPVKAPTIEDHVMHAERFEIGADAALRINRARAGGGRIAAVGTTVLRALESVADAAGLLAPVRGSTDLFITPGYRFKAVDLLMTNFHLPRSTLFVLVAAFAGLDRMRAAYRHAVAERYRFYSFGDACLLARQPA